MEPTFFATPAAFRAWLADHGEREPELIAGFYKRASGRPSITWPQSVDEALCFGWIDGVRQSLDDSAYTIRFTPRRARSRWSEVNTRRALELRATGRMTPAGLAAFEAREESRTAEYSYEARQRPLERALEAEFRAHREAWAFFEAQPPGYRRTAQWYVMSAKRDDTRRRRLRQLIEHSTARERLPQAGGAARSRQRRSS